MTSKGVLNIPLCPTEALRSAAARVAAYRGSMVWSRTKGADCH